MPIGKGDSGMQRVSREEALKEVEKIGGSFEEGQMLHNAMVEFLKQRFPDGPPSVGPIQKLQAMRAWWNIISAEDREAIALSLLTLMKAELIIAKRDGLIDDSEMAA